MASPSHDEPMAPPNIEERRNEEQRALRTAFREARRKWLEVMLDQDFVKGMDPEQRDTYLQLAMQDILGATSFDSPRQDPGLRCELCNRRDPGAALCPECGLFICQLCKRWGANCMCGHISERRQAHSDLDGSMCVPVVSVLACA